MFWARALMEIAGPLSDHGIRGRLGQMVKNYTYIERADEIDHLVLECGANGYSYAQIAACIGISREKLNTWAKTYPRLAETLSRAATLSQAWWEGRAMDGTANSRIGGSVWGKSMAARFPRDYAERLEQGQIGEAGRVSKIEWEIVDPKEDSG